MHTSTWVNQRWKQATFKEGIGYNPQRKLSRVETLIQQNPANEMTSKGIYTKGPKIANWPMKSKYWQKRLWKTLGLGVCPVPGRFYKRNARPGCSSTEGNRHFALSGEFHQQNARPRRSFWTPRSALIFQHDPHRHPRLLPHGLLNECSKPIPKPPRHGPRRGSVKWVRINLLEFLY